MLNSAFGDDFRAILKFPFAAPRSRNNFLAGAALFLAGMFIPLLPALLVYGYIVQVLRRAVRGNELIMPEWKDWGQLAYDGLRSLLIGALFLGPGMLTVFAGLALYFGVWFGGLQLLEQADSGSAAWPLVLIIGAVAILFLSLLAGWLFSLAGLGPLPAALAHFAARNHFSAAFDVPAWSRVIAADKLGYFLGWVIVLGLGSLTYLVFTLVYLTGVLCFLANFIVLPFAFYLLLVGAAVFGNHYRAAAARLAAPPA